MSGVVSLFPPMEAHPVMEPVTIGGMLSMVVLGQEDAEARIPEPLSGLISITGVGWKAFHSIHEQAYSEGILRLVLDDVEAAAEGAELADAIRAAISMARRVSRLGSKATLVIHCHAGVSRSTAMAVGCAAALLPDTLEEAVDSIRAGIAATGRRFVPNQVILSQFEIMLGLLPGRLAKACHHPRNRTGNSHWCSRAKAIASTLLSCVLASTAAAQDVRSPMVIERGLTSRELVPCGRDSKPPPDCGMDLNASDADALASLPGMDPVTAVRIVRGRPYGHVGDIMERGIVTTTTFDVARSYLWVMRASLNGSTAAELASRLGITRDKADQIVRKRPWNNVDDLSFQGILSMTELERVRSLISLR